MRHLQGGGISQQVASSAVIQEDGGPSIAERINGELIPPIKRTSGQPVIIAPGEKFFGALLQ
jgi:hypothetical protein